MIKKLGWSLLFAAIIIASLYFYWEYNRKSADLVNTKPAFIVTASNLVSDFETDEAAANKKFLGKVIQVNGVLASADYSQDTLINITLGDGLHRVGCQFDKRHSAGIEKLQEMHTISVKGICTGYLMDVELNRCVIVK